MSKTTVSSGVKSPAVDVLQLHKKYGEVSAITGLSWSVAMGEWWGVIGPNGSGKSTLIQVLSGVEQPGEGEVRIMGRPVSEYRRKELSRIIAVLQQEGLPPMGYTVRDVVDMGRFPHQDWLGRDHDGDTRQITEQVLGKLELLPLAERRLDQLSGGQRQRVALAKVMTQEPQILLLDEPTTYLDIRYQLQFMELLSEWRQETGITIVAVLHDLNLAAQFCDRMLILQEGQAGICGTPSELLTEDTLRKVYDIDSLVIEHPDHGAPQLLLRRSSRR
ncbi:ABC transporter ATP-binding protein [Paenibacillus massiliensis]|uniref:ABC transporter ATP-binding protein n=1 Tax=Paenibacillus massiliensis TaxID=225917 RepID=UPI0003FA05F3|nr:ABC transporter ATP-binding protein [Paenibacillus massiliensis]